MNTTLCPRFHKAIELVGSRWTGAILQILLGGRARFTAIGAAIPDISDRMLSDRLHALEREGIVVRTVIPESPIRVEYELSEKGRELQASLTSIAHWAERWIEDGVRAEGTGHRAEVQGRKRAKGRREGRSKKTGAAGARP